MNPYFQPNESQGSTGRSWWSVMHLSSLLGWVLPLASVLAPLFTVIFRSGEDPIFRNRGMAYVRLQLKLILLPVFWLFFWLCVILAYGLSLVLKIAQGEDLGLLEIFWRLGQLFVTEGEGGFPWDFVYAAFLNPTLLMITAFGLVMAGSFVWMLFQAIYSVVCALRSDDELRSKSYLFEGLMGSLVLFSLALLPHVLAAILVWQALSSPLPAPQPPTHFL